MKYLLDTNTCIRFINGRAPKLRDAFIQKMDTDIVICTITKAEMFYGSAKSQTPEISRAKQEQFFKRFVMLSFDEKSAYLYGLLRADLEQQGTPIGPYDMLIAAIALANELTLVTHNVGEFSRVKGLKIEDWEA